MEGVQGTEEHMLPGEPTSPEKRVHGGPEGKSPSHMGEPDASRATPQARVLAWSPQREPRDSREAQNKEVSWERQEEKSQKQRHHRFLKLSLKFWHEVDLGWTEQESIC